MYKVSHGKMECTGPVTGNWNVLYESQETGMYRVSHGKLECKYESRKNGMYNKSHGKLECTR